MAIQYNINTVGTLTNNNGVLSGFSNGNYATIPNGVDLGADFEVVFKIKLAQIPDSGTWQGIFAGENGYYFQLSIGDSGKIGLDYGNGSSWSDFFETTSTLATNTDYYIKVTYDGTAYKLLLSTDGTTYTEENSQSSNVIIPEFTGLIGSNKDLTNFFDYGSIDLNGCYIKVDNATVWEGVTNTTGVHIQLRRDTLANWTSVNPTLYNGEVGLITDQAQYVVGDGNTAFTSLTKHNMDADISNLADKSLSNLTAAGRLTIGYSALPTSTGQTVIASSPDSIALPASGTSYTASKNGYVYIYMQFTSGYVILRNSTLEVSGILNASTFGDFTLIPARQFDSYTLDYSGASGIGYYVYKFMPIGGNV